MRVVNTKISDEDFQKIISSGDKVYGFAQQAIKEKLAGNAFEKKQIESRIEFQKLIEKLFERIEKSEESFKDEILHVAKAEVQVVTDILLERDKEHLELKQKLNENFKTLISKITK